MSGKASIFRLLLWVFAAAVCLKSVPAHAISGDIKKISINDVKRMRADSWRAVGKNLIIEGDVYFPIGPFEIYADHVIVNTESKDFEATGNVRFFHWQRDKVPVTLNELADVEKYNNSFVHEVTSSVSPLGERSYQADVSYQRDQITADKVVGNINTSFFSFTKPTIRYNSFLCRADSAERTSDGVVVLKNGELSTCSYLESNNAHYSITASEIRLTPHEARFYQFKHADMDPGDRSVLLVNGAVRMYGVPIMWLPVFYKPKDESPGLCGFQQGRSGDWGYFVRLYRSIHFTDAPEMKARLMFDWYEKRGFGYGIKGSIAAPESNTEFFAYWIYDKDPLESEDYDDYRLKVRNWRYDFRLTNITHITPRLDFRGVFEYQSDPYIRRDFFENRYWRDPQPATFAALEQQFDNFSVSAMARMRVNDFYTTVEKLPEVRIDVPRQEILNTGFYYQGDLSAAYMRMKWIDFDEPPRQRKKGKKQNWSTLLDYESFRLDTTHFLYYPVATKYFTFVPRIGFKITAYSKTSKEEVDSENLITMFTAADPEGLGRQKFVNYDEKGGGKVRLAGELGFELSTKLHNTWNNVRSALFDIDGIRHVIQPYVNYTFIPKPTLSRDKIMFFDDIDRIDKQNFFRLGVINRLQTRDGSNVSTFFRMENYWDIHLTKDEDGNHFGNFGTIISMRILKGLTLNTQFLINVDNNTEVTDTYRHGRNVGKTGIAQSWLNMFDLSIKYSPATNWVFAVGYNMIRPYDIRSAYSMGSTLTQINATSYFDRYYNDVEESFFLSATMPLTPDHRTLGKFIMTYDVPEGSIDFFGFMVVRQFHCWQLVASVGMEYEYEDNDKVWEPEYSISANLTGLNPAMNSVQNGVLRSAAALSNSKFEF